MLIIMLTCEEENKQIGLNADMNISSSADLGLISALGIFLPEIHGEDAEELKKRRRVKKKE